MVKAKLKEQATRACPMCKVVWIHQGTKGRECPKCQAGSFLTMNLGSIGAAAYFEQSGECQDNYKFVDSGITPRAVCYG